MTQTFYADQIVSSNAKRGLVRYEPGYLKVGKSGKILDVGRLSRSKLASSSKSIIREKCIIPGLIDSHTHLVYGGVRAGEWNRRLKGESYEAIAREGGGIQTTVRETRRASKAELLKLAKARLKKILRFGVTSLEVKTGYGLDFDSEKKCLEVIQALKQQSKISIYSTFLAAHALAPEFSKTSKYVDHIIESMLPAIQGLADFQDVFVERGFFGVEESVRLLEAGAKLGLRPKVHAHEFGRTGGVEVARRCRAVSADHLQHMNDEDLRALKSSKTVPVVLPGTSFFLGGDEYAPARKIWDAGLPLAIASDYNPGTNPSHNFPLCGSIAALKEGLSLDEILIAQTDHAARALGLTDRGLLQKGKRADFVCLDARGFEEMYYYYGDSLAKGVYVAGKKVA